MASLEILDGSNYIFRAYFALMQGKPGGRQIQLSNAAGMPTGALHVFTGMLLKVLGWGPTHFTVVFDAQGPNFRHEHDAAYKANRTAPPDDLVPQFPYFERIVRVLGLPVIRQAGVEADDVIASIVRVAREQGASVKIYTGDKDLMQLVDDHVRVVDGMRDITYDAAKVREKFGVPPEQVRDFLALRGDTSDNVPGLSGVGDKTAAKLLTEHGSIAGILAAAPIMKGKLGETLRDPVQRERLERSMFLVSLKSDVEVPKDIDAYARGRFGGPELRELFEELGFQKYLERMPPLPGAEVGGASVAHVAADVPPHGLEGDADDKSASGQPGGAPAIEPAAPYVDSESQVPARVILELGELQAWLATAADDGPLAWISLLGVGAVPRRELVGIALATAKDSVYVPVSHRTLGAPIQLASDDVLAALMPVLSDAALPKVVADWKEECLVLGDRASAVRGIACDVHLSAHLVDPTQGGYDLPSLSAQHGGALPPLDQVLGKGAKRRPFSDMDVDTGARWGGQAAREIRRLAARFVPALERLGLSRLALELELPLGRVLAVMERDGIRVDTGFLERLGQKVGQDCAALETQIQTLAGSPINPGSPKQLQELLFNKLGLRSERMRKTKTGFSVDAKALEEMRDLHPVVPLLLEHRELIKLKGTYLDALPPLVDRTTSRLHTSYVQTGASTGRIASQHPNIQNIPIRTPLGKEIRRAFVAEPGSVLLSLDYSQIELRILAHLSKDSVLCAAFAQGIDVHAQTAAEVFGIPLAQVGAEHRRVAKAVNYGLGYGQTDFGLSQALGIPRGEAKRYIDTYFERFAGVRRFMDETIVRARETGRVSTIMGRVMALPGLASKSFPERTGAERVARNAPIQGSAADLLKVAMLRVQDLIERAPAPGPRMLLTVHDELVFEVPQDKAEAFGAQARHLMENAHPLDVPLLVDMGIGPSWADAH